MGRKKMESKDNKKIKIMLTPKLQNETSEKEEGELAPSPPNTDIKRSTTNNNKIDDKNKNNVNNNSNTDNKLRRSKNKTSSSTNSRKNETKLNNKNKNFKQFSKLPSVRD